MLQQQQQQWQGLSLSLDVTMIVTLNHMPCISSTAEGGGAIDSDTHYQMILFDMPGMQHTSSSSSRQMSGQFWGV
jgi:hypothetical protein